VRLDSWSNPIDLASAVGLAWRRPALSGLILLRKCVRLSSKEIGGSTVKQAYTGLAMLKNLGPQTAERI